MKPFLLSFFLILSLSGFSQTDTTLQHKSQRLGGSIITLNRQQIERLPAVNLMEVLNGAFAFATAEPLRVSDYSFLIDGWVSVNPNAISLTQIESISFYPNNTVETRSNLTQKGTFVITTTKKNSGWQLTTNTGAWIGRLSELHRPPYETTTMRAGNGLLTQTELSYAMKNVKYCTSVAATFTRGEGPGITSVSSTRTEQDHWTDNRYRLSILSGIRFNTHWSLDGNISYSMLPQKGSVNSNSMPDVTSSNTLRHNTQLFGAALSLRYQSASKLENIFSVETNQYRNKREGEGYSRNPNFQYSFISNRKSNYQQYTLTNHTRWHFLQKHRVQATAYLLARYRNLNQQDSNFYQQQDMSPGGSVSTFMMSSRLSAKGFIGTVGIQSQFGKWLTVDASLTADDYKPYIPVPQSVDRKLMPDVAVDLSLLPLFQTTSLSRFSLTGSYSSYINTHQMPDATDWDIHRPFIVYYSATDVGTDAGRMADRWMAGIAAGNKDRLLIQVNYRIDNKELLYLVPISWGTGQVFQPVIVPVQQKGMGIELTAVPLKKEKLFWQIQTAVHSRRFEARNDQGNFIVKNSADYSERMQWSGGIKTELQVQRFFAQASVLVIFDKWEWSGPQQRNYFNTADANFFLAGLRFDSRSKWLQSWELNLQSRNLLFSKEYRADMLYRYAGIGARLNFRQ